MGEYQIVIVLERARLEQPIQHAEPEQRIRASIKGTGVRTDPRSPGRISTRRLCVLCPIAREGVPLRRDPARRTLTVPLVAASIREPVGETEVERSSHRRALRKTGMGALMLGAPGVVYGDIGTSPLYSL